MPCIPKTDETSMNQSLHVVCPHCDTVNRVPRAKLAAGGRCGACHQPLFEGRPVALDGARFARHLEQSDIPCWSISGHRGAGLATPWLQPSNARRAGSNPASVSSKSISTRRPRLPSSSVCAASRRSCSLDAVGRSIGSPAPDRRPIWSTGGYVNRPPRRVFDPASSGIR